MDLVNLDLNLLVVLDALLREVSVTRAAQQLHVSQPAVSGSLAKLRRHFDDPLLRRVGNRYELTPLALHLKSRTAVAIEGAHRVFDARPTFDVTTEQRQFTLLASDYAMATVGEALTARFTKDAPGVRLQLGLLTPSAVTNAEQVLRTVDGLVLPHGFVSDLPHTDLYQDDWMCLVASTNQRVGRELTMELLAELPWAYTYFSPVAFTAAGRQMQLMAIKPHVQIVVESFLALPFVVAGTDRIAFIQSRLVPRLTASGEVRALPCPFDAIPITEAMWWHPVYEHDPAHIWLRDRLAEAGHRATPPRRPR